MLEATTTSGALQIVFSVWAPEVFSVQHIFVVYCKQIFFQTSSRWQSTRFPATTTWHRWSCIVYIYISFSFNSYIIISQDWIWYSVVEHEEGETKHGKMVYREVSMLPTLLGSLHPCASRGHEFKHPTDLIHNRFCVKSLLPLVGRALDCRDISSNEFYKALKGRISCLTPLHSFFLAGPHFTCFFFPPFWKLYEGLKVIGEKQTQSARSWIIKKKIHIIEKFMVYSCIYTYVYLYI